MLLVFAAMSMVFTRIVLYIIELLIDRVEDERFNCDYEQIGAECSICALDKMKWPIELGCGHRYCFDCLKKWFKNQEKYENSKTCPHCRTDVKTISSINWKSSVTWWKTIVQRCHAEVRKVYNPGQGPQPRAPYQILMDLLLNAHLTILTNLTMIVLAVLYARCYVFIYNFINGQQIEGDEEHIDNQKKHVEKVMVLVTILLMSTPFFKNKFTRPALVRFVNTN